MNLKWDAIQALSLKAAGVGLFLVYSVFLARVLPTAEYGRVTYAITLLMVFSPVCLFGYERTSMKYAAIYWGEKDIAHLSGLLKRARLVGLRNSFSLFFLAGLLSAIGLLDASSDIGHPVILAILVLPLWVWVVLNREYQRGLKLMIPSLIGFQILRPVFAILLTAIAYLYWHLSPFIVMMILGTALGLVIVIDWFRIHVMLKIKHDKPRYENEKWLSTARPLFLSTVMNILMSRTDMLLVGALLGMKAAALYAAAQRLATLPAFALDAVRTAISPHIAEQFHKGNIDLLQDQVDKASRWIFFGTLPVAGILLFFAHFFLGLFGEEYNSAIWILVFLISGQIINAAAGTAGPLLTMTGFQRENAQILAVSLIIYIILLVIFLHFFGAEGAALATALTMGIRNLWMVVMVKRKVRLTSYARIF